MGSTLQAGTEGSASFGLRDTLQFVVPGAAFLLIVGLVDANLRDLAAQPGLSPTGTVVPEALFLRESMVDAVAKMDWKQAPALAAMSVLLLLASFLLGHLISTVAIFAIDRTLIFRGYRYPFQRLFPTLFQSQRTRWDDASRGFYRGTFFWINAYLLCRYLSLYQKWPGLGVGATMIGIVVVVVVLAKTVLNFVVGDSQAWLHAAIRKRVNPRHELENTLGVRAVSFFFYRIYAGPQNMLTYLLDSAAYINVSAGLDDEFTEKYVHFFRNRFSLEPTRSGTNNYWLPYCYVRERSPRLWTPLSGLETMFRFSMNLSAALFIGFVYTFGVLAYQDLAELTSLDHILFLLPPVFLGVALLLFSRFYHFYGAAHVRLLYRSFVALCMLEDRFPTSRVADAQGGQTA